MNNPLKATLGKLALDPIVMVRPEMARCLGPPTARREIGYMIRYIIAGAAGNALVLVVYYSLTSGFGWTPGKAFALACASVLPISFALSRNWAFRSQAPIVRAFLSFSGGYAASFVFQLGVLYLGIWLGAPHQFVVPVGQILAVTFFYTLQRFVLFKTA